MICKTVKIKSGDSFIIINESDFDSSKHTIFKAKPAKKVKAK